MTNAPMIDLRDTTKKCDGGPPALAGVTLSTTMRMILGPDAPDSGAPFADGRPQTRLCDPLKQVWAPVDATATNPSLERPAPHVLAASSLASLRSGPARCWPLLACPASCAAILAGSPRA